MAQHIMNQSKTQFYGNDGTGRDQYIQSNNGGFCPAKGPCQIEELGTQHTYQAMHYDMAIHSATPESFCYTRY